MHVKYVIFDIYDKVDIHGIGYMSCINMSMWVSKEASGTEDRSRIQFDDLLNDFIVKMFKIHMLGATRKLKAARAELKEGRSFYIFYSHIFAISGGRKKALFLPNAFF